MLAGPAVFLIIALATFLCVALPFFVLPIHSSSENKGREPTEGMFMEDFTTTTPDSKTNLQLQELCNKRVLMGPLPATDPDIKDNRGKQEIEPHPRRGHQRALEKTTQVNSSNNLVPGTLVLSSLARATSEIQNEGFQCLFYLDPPPAEAFSAFVVVLDLDLLRIPSPDQIYDHIQRMGNVSENYVTCGLGNWHDHSHLRGKDF